MVIGFDTEKYIKLQKEKIFEKVRQYGKLYFELGGKLFDDYHASRVLPGFEPDTKIKLFDDLKEQAELVICINSENIQNRRIRSDYNTLYVDDCMRLISTYRKMGFLVSGVALTLFKKQPKAIEFATMLTELGENVYFLNYIQNYPNNFEEIIKSFEENDFITTSRPLVIMTSSGSASGKLSACLSQIYKEFKRGNKVGYSKYDIFPVWNLPVNHPINLAFEAATADSNDRILIDEFYYQKYHKIVSNYNRDFDVFPFIKKMFCLIFGEEIYSSPTEMVINTMKEAIIDEKLICQAGKAEICRRYLTYYKQYLRNQSNETPILRVKQIMDENSITMNDLSIVPIAKKLFKKSAKMKSIVIELNNKRVLLANETKMLSIGANLLITFLNDKNAIDMDSIISFSKSGQLLHIPDILELYMEKKEIIILLEELKGCNAHTSYLIPVEEEFQIKSLGINITCEPVII